MNDSPLYELQGVSKEYSGPSERIVVLSEVDLTVAAGDSLAILGSSGSGKTTLLHLLGTLDIATRGTILFQGRDLATLNPQQRAGLRNLDIGFVFQFHHLLPEFTTLENVAMPARIAGHSKKKSLEAAEKTLVLMGLQDRMKHRVTTLSGGERQRAAIARSVLLNPKVLLADEPTGNLDEKTGETVGQALVRLNEEMGTTLIIVTHNQNLARCMGRNLELRSGELYAIR
ncbi:MAG: ABC transporter ATP-binding protein [Desulfovibrionales bacterium]